MHVRPRLKLFDLFIGQHYSILMNIQKAFRYRLSPNATQLKAFLGFSGACRWVYNRGLAERNDAWQNSKKSISLFTQNKALTVLKAQEETAWLKDVHSQVLQQSLHDLDLAFLNFFRRVKNKDESPGYPKFKCKGDHDSFRYPQGVKVQDSRVWLPKIGWVRFRKSREVQGAIKQTTVIKEGKHWFVSFSCEWEEEDTIQPIACKVVGIDVGLENFATTVSDNQFEEIAFPGFLRKNLSHLRYLGRQLSYKAKHSKNWQKAKAQLRAFHAKIRYRRQDFLHKISTRLVKSHDMVVVENLKIQKLLKTSGRYLARSIADAGWRQFLLMLKYKCVYASKQLVEAAEYFPSTQLCSQCSAGNTLSLSMRQYSCSCGLVIHRDRNAALNLHAVGMTV